MADHLAFNQKTRDVAGRPWPAPYGHHFVMTNFVPDKIINARPVEIHGCMNVTRVQGSAKRPPFNA